MEERRLLVVFFQDQAMKSYCPQTDLVGLIIVRLSGSSTDGVALQEAKER